jgi:hypothetical protein
MRMNLKSSSLVLGLLMCLAPHAAQAGIAISINIAPPCSLFTRSPRARRMDTFGHLDIGLGARPDTTGYREYGLRHRALASSGLPDTGASVAESMRGMRATGGRTSDSTVV